MRVLESALFFYCQKIYSYAIPDGNMLSEAGWMICRLSVLLIICFADNVLIFIFFSIVSNGTKVEARVEGSVW